MSRSQRGAGRGFRWEHEAALARGIALPALLSEGVSEQRILVARATARVLAIPPTELSGREHLLAALAGGRGAVLWVAPSRHSDLMTKVALQRAGFPAVHLSRRSHGSWRSPFGRKHLNPVTRRTEDRYLRRRVMIGDETSTRALRELLRALGENEVVTIRLGPEAQRTTSRPFLGEQVRVPLGPIRLASTARAPLLPVVMRREAGRFETIVLPPLSSTSDPGRAAEQFLAAIEPFARRAPADWAGTLPR